MKRKKNTDLLLSSEIGEKLWNNKVFKVSFTIWAITFVLFWILVFNPLNMLFWIVSIIHLISFAIWFFMLIKEDFDNNPGGCMPC